MKKLYILIIGIMILCIIGCSKLDDNQVNNDNILIRQIFGIDEKKYEFDTEIKNAGFYLPVDDSESYDIVIKNMIGIKVATNDKIYERMGSIKRKISVTLEPMTVMSYVYYSKCKDNINQLYIIYVE